FIGVADQINGLLAFAIHERPFQPAGKTGAAPASQPGDSDLLADLLGTAHSFSVRQRFWRQRNRLSKALVAAVAEITGHIQRVAGLVGIFQNEAVFLRHIFYQALGALRTSLDSKGQ